MRLCHHGHRGQRVISSALKPVFWHHSTSLATAPLKLALRPSCADRHLTVKNLSGRSFSKSSPTHLAAPFSVAAIPSITQLPQTHRSTMSAETHLPMRDAGSKLVATELEKPDLDSRSYRVVRLPNKLEALLVHDPETDKASAALDVHVGNFSDSDELQGQAHAVEHLLFMGTKKYPKENEYSQYLSEHNGYSNAYTASTSTNYYFEVAEKQFEGALDRFAQFFIEPLFLEETLERELQAVDSENKKNLQNDQWRLHQLAKTLSNPKHPYCHFSTGNLETLKHRPAKRGVNVRDEFINFHARHYSANRMKLVVLGRHSLDTLEGWVLNMFKDVKNKDLPEPKFEGQPFTEKELLTQIFAKPVMQNRQLDLTFPFLDEEPLYKTHPSRYITHLIGHEGPGSVLAYLKKKGWANSLSAGPTHVSDGCAFLYVTIKLTEAGLSKYQEVAKVVFNYINLIKETPIQEWIVQELQTCAAIDFKFRQQTPPAKFTSRMSSVMQKPLPREWLLSGTSLIREFDPKIIEEAMQYLRPDNFRMTIISQECPSGEFDQKEPWYGTEYRVEKIPKAFLEELKSTAGKGKGAGKLSGELHLPHKNEFIPTKFEVNKKEPKEKQTAPALLKNTDISRIWFKKDDTFWVPKANASFTLRNPLVYANPANTVASRIYCELVKDALNEYAYDAEIAGLDYSVTASSLGFEIEVSGYNDKMAILLEKVLLSLRDLEILQERFDIIKEKTLRAYRNWDFQVPYYQVGEYARYLQAQIMWTNEECLPELEALTVDDVKALVPRVMKQLHIEGLIHGNLYKEDALKYTDLIESILKPRPLRQCQHGIRRSLKLPSGASYVYNRPLKDPKNVNAVVEYCLYIGEQTDRKLRSMLSVFAQLTDEPAFDQLRTKEQLGYIVFSGVRYGATTMGYRVLVQSEKTAPYLETRIEQFLTDYKVTLDKMTEKEFQNQVLAVINRRTEKMKNLNQESGRLWNHIGSEFYDFFQIPLEVEILKSLKKEDIVAFYDAYVSPTSRARAKLSVHMQPFVAPKPPTAAALKEQVVSGLSKFLTATAKITTDVPTLTQALINADITEDSIISAVQKYLEDVHKLSQEQVTTTVSQGKALLKPLLTTARGEVAEGREFGEVIEDVETFKASLEVTRGARPVKPIVEYEETAVKL